MKKHPWLTVCLILVGGISPLSAQGIAIGARGGTLGLGGEIAFGLSDAIVFRGGYGVFPYDYEDTFDGADYTVAFPSGIWSAGIDLYPGGGPIRLMGGVMGRVEDVTMRSSWSGSREIGDDVYDVPGAMKGYLRQDPVAPFAGIGFGKHTSGGFGFFLDVGVAFSGKGDVELELEGPISQVPGVEQSLRQEADLIEEEAGGLLKVWPIVSLGIKIPIAIGY